MRNSFVFYGSWWEAIKNLPRDVQGDVLTAIIEYGLSGETTEQLKPIAKAMLAMVKPQIDVNNKRFENGKKGGRPKCENEPNQNQEKTKREPKSNQNETKTEPNLNVNVNDNLNEDNKKEILSNESIKKKAASAATHERKEAFYHSLIPYADKYGKEMLRAFFDYWSEMNASQTKMRFEKQPTWELSKRLATWANNEKKYEKNRRPATELSKQERAARFAADAIAYLAAGDNRALQDGGESDVPF